MLICLNNNNNGINIKKIFAVLLVMAVCLQLFAAHPLSALAAAEYVVVITGNAVEIKKDAGDSFSAVRVAETGRQYKYISEKKAPDGAVWYKIQSSLLVSGWVSSRDSEKFWAGAGELEIFPVITDIAASYGTVGMQAAVIENGEVTETFCFGYAVDHERKMTDDDKIRVASLSKVFTAMNIMKLREMGVVELDTDISRYWGQTLPKPITLRSLLTHTSTLGDLSTGYNMTREGTLKQLSRKESYIGGTIGVNWWYNNYGIGIAGSTAEVAADRALDDIAHEYFLDGLGIDASFRSGSVKEHNYALPYRNSGVPAMTVEELEKKTVSAEPGCNTASFAGGLTISARDYAKLIAVLANGGQYGGTEYLSPETVAAMESPALQVTDHGGTFTQCMPLRYAENLYGQSRLYYHTGNAYGVLALASFNPDTRCGVVVVTTGAGAYRDAQGIYAVCGNITRRLYNYIGDKKVRDIRLSRSYADLAKGDKLVLRATLEPSNIRGDITWTSSEPRVAQVSDKGKVTVTGCGTAVIKAESEGVAAECIVNSAPALSAALAGCDICAERPDGLRFTVNIDKDADFGELKTAGYGIVAAPSGLLDGAELTVETENAVIIPAKKLLTDDGSRLTYSCAVTEIPAQAYGTGITARGYIVYTGDDMLRHYVYTDEAERSLLSTAVSEYMRYSSLAALDSRAQAAMRRAEDILGIKSGKASLYYGERAAASGKTDNCVSWNGEWLVSGEEE